MAIRLCLVILLGLLAAVGRGEEPVAITERLPYGEPPVDYFGVETHDAVARLIERLAAGEAELRFAEDGGYLPAVLDALDVPVESQLLVFSKTALNPQLVGPENPRAIYFNDEVSVAGVPGAASLEMAALDPVKGAVFYTLAQDGGADQPQFRRETRCLACHAGTSTLQVPGLMLRSFLTDESGKPLEGYSQVTHATPLEKRLAGWYATGTHGSQRHLGNLVGRAAVRRHKTGEAPGGNITELAAFFDPAKHLAPHSDLVAHLVLAHQVHGQNLLIRVGQEARLGRRSDAEEQLVRYLLFADEPPLAEPVRGTSRFAEQFEQRGPQDAKGRSLRQFDLQTRLFRYRLSYLIDSPLFDGLPAAARDRVYRRLWEILSAPASEAGFEHLPADERRAIIQIVRATKADLPKFWLAP